MANWVQLERDGSAMIDGDVWPKAIVDNAALVGQQCRCGECTCCEIKQAKDNTRQGVFFVASIGISRCYGGPEEGGWWYDWCDVHEIEQVESWQGGMEVIRTLRGEHPTQQYDRHSVLGNGEDTEIILARTRAEIERYQSTERPHYE